MNQQIKATEIKPGMILSIYGSTRQVPVTKVLLKWDAVQVTDGIEWAGLAETDLVKILGYFNP